MNVDPLIVEACRRVGKEEGTPDFIVDAVIQHLAPSIRLVVQNDTTVPLGKSRIGGLPDLPEGIRWPRFTPSKRYEIRPEIEKHIGTPLSFLLQVNLKDVPHASEFSLPDTGLLSFFYLDVIHLEIYDDRPDMGAVTLTEISDSADELQPMVPPAEMAPEQVFRPVALTPQIEITVPAFTELDIDEHLVSKHLELWNTIEEEVEQVQGFGPWYSPKHRMLGHPQLIQSFGLADGTNLMLQVDSDAMRKEYPNTGMMWGDGGRIYYLISTGDLAKRRFHKASTYLEMS